MGDPLSTIRSVTALHEAQADQLRSSLLQLADRIAKSLSAADVHVASENVVLDRYGDDESVYGFLSYSDGEFTVAYRRNEDHFISSLASIRIQANRRTRSGRFRIVRSSGCAPSLRRG